MRSMDFSFGDRFVELAIRLFSSLLIQTNERTLWNQSQSRFQQITIQDWV
jgi:hypothetical protein